MPRKQADIQGAMLNVEQQINFALDQNNKFTNDLNNNVLGLLAREDAMLAQEAQQTDLLSHIANKPVSSTPAETLLQPIVTVESIQEPTQYEQAPMPTPEGQVEAVSNTEIDISPITSELTSQTTILREIADNLKPSATEEGDMSPGEDAMKKVGGKDLSKDAGKGVGTVLMIGGAIVALGLSLYLFKQFKIGIKDFLMISAGLSILFLSISQIAKGEMDIKKGIITLILIAGTMAILGSSLALIGDIDTVKLVSFMGLTALLIASMAAVGQFKVNLLDIIMFDAYITTFIQAIVNISYTLQDLQTIKKDKIITLLSLTAAILPIYAILGNLKAMAFVKVALASVILPRIALTMVATAHQINNMPESLSMSKVANMVMLSISLYPLLKSAKTIFDMAAPMAQSTGLEGLMNRSSFGKDGFTLSKTGGGPNYYLSTLFRLGASFAMLPLLALTMLGLAYLFSAFGKAGGDFKTSPPLSWSVSVGVAMWFFAQSLGRIVQSVDPKTTDSVEHFNKKGKKTLDKKNITQSNLPGSLALMGMLALTIVSTAYILKLFPKDAEAKAPSQKWIMSAGIGILLFSIALKKIMQATEEDDSFNFRKNKTLSGGGSKETDIKIPMFGPLMLVNLMALSMVGIAWIFKLFPQDAKSPPLKWVLSIGIAMLLFAKAYNVISTVTTQSAGLVGKMTGGSDTKMSSVGRSMAGVLYMNLMAVTMVTVALVLSVFPKNPVSPPITWTLSTGLALLIFAKATSLVMSMKNKVNIKGEGNTVNLKGGSSIMQALGGLVFVASIALSIVATAYIFKLLPNEYNAPKLGWVLKSGMALVIFSLPIAMLIKVKGSKQMEKESKKVNPSQGIKQSGGVLGQIVLTALAIVATTFIFQALPNDSMLKAPPLWWTIKAGAAVFTFGAAMVLINKYLLKKGNLTAIGALKTIGIMAAIAAASVLIAWLYQALPSRYKAPDLLWSIKVGIAMLAFIGVMALLRVSKIKIRHVIKFGFLIIAVAAVVVATSQIFQAFAASRIRLTDILLLTVAVGVIAGIGYLLGRTKHSRKIKRGLWIMTLISIPLATLGLALLAWKLVNPNPKKTVIQLGLIVLTVGVFSLIGYILGNKKYAGRIALGLLVMSLAALPIIILAFAFGKWTETFPDATAASAQLLLFGVAMTVLAVGLYAIGTPEIAGFVALGAAVLMLIGAAILVVGEGFKSVAEGMGDALKSDIFKQSGEKNIFGMGMSNFEVIMGAMIKGFIIPPMLLPMLYLSIPAFLLAGGALFVIGKSLMQFQGLNISAKDLAGIPFVLTALTDAFAEVGKKNAKEGFSFAQGLFVRGPIAEGIHAIKGAGAVLAEITTGLIAFADMKFTDVNGKTIVLDGAKLRSVTDNIVMVLDSLSMAFEIVGLRNKKDYGFGDSFFGKLMNATPIGLVSMAATQLFARGPVADGIKAVSGMGAVLSEITTGLIAFADMKFMDIEGNPIMLDGAKLRSVTDNIVMVLDTLSLSFKIIGERNKKESGFAGDTVLGKLFNASPLGLVSMAATQLFTRGPVADGIKAVAGMGKVLSEITTGLIAFADMKFMDVEGNPIMLDETRLTTTIDNVVLVLDTLSIAFAKIGEKNKKDYGFAGDTVLGKLFNASPIGIMSMAATQLFTKGPVAEGVKAVSGMGLIISQVAQGLVAFAEMKYTDIEGNPIIIDDDVLINVQANIVSVLSALGNAFLEMGTRRKDRVAIKNSIKSIRGIGTEIVSIAQGVKDFAALTFGGGGEEGNPVTFTVDDLKYVKGSPDKWGPVLKTIYNVVSAVSNVFLEIGDRQKDRKKIKNTIKALSGMGAEVVNIVTAVGKSAKLMRLDQSLLKSTIKSAIEVIPNALLAVNENTEGKEDAIKETATFLSGISYVLVDTISALKGTNEITEDQITLYETTIPRLITIIPSAIIDTIEKVTEKVGDPAAAFSMMNETTTAIADAIDKIASHQEPLEKIATSFETISSSMVDMKEAVNELDVVRMEKMNTMFSTIKDIAYPESGLPIQDIPGQVAKATDRALDKILGKTEKALTQLEQVQKETTKAQATVADAEGGGGGGASATFMLERFQSLEDKVKILNKTMEKVILALGATLEVKINNIEAIGGG